MMKKSRGLKKWSKLNVPEGIWFEILTRLPVKSLLRFRCVCSSWRALIDDPNFSQLHLTRFKNNHSESHLFFVQRSQLWSAECVLRCSKTLRITARLGFLQTDLPSSNTIRTTEANGPIQCWVVSCWIDGLFMLKNKTYSIEIQKLMLWNPSLRKTRILSLPPEISSDHLYFDFGLGFDPLVKDYKFVRLLLRRGAASVYTVGTNSWKTIEIQGEGSSIWKQDVRFPYRQITFCLRGILYALAGNQDSSTPKFPLLGLNKLVSFDLNKEMFASTQLPLVDNPISNWYTRSLTMVDDGSSLAVVNLMENRGSIWVLQSLGDDMKSLSWSQRWSFAMTMPQSNVFLGPAEFLYMKKNGEMVFKCQMMRAVYDKYVLISYNLETQKENIVLKEIMLKGNTWPYMQSLILL